MNDKTTSNQPLKQKDGQDSYRPPGGQAGAWLIVVLLAWIIGSLGPLIQGLFIGSLAFNISLSFGSAMSLMLISAVPAYLIRLGFRLSKRPLSPRNFVILFGCCVIAIGFIVIIGNLHWSTR